MIKEQNNKCKMCGNNETTKINGKIKELSIDHDHKTKKIRGLLCLRCNIILGHFEKLKNNKELIERCVTYLSRYSRKETVERFKTNQFEVIVV